MASSVSGQDESNPALWLATRAGKMELSCPLGTTRRVLQEKFPRKSYNKSFIDQACSVKVAGYWPRSFFCEFMDLDSVSIHKHAKKELGQYPAILTSHLVNSPYVWMRMELRMFSTTDVWRFSQNASTFKYSYDYLFSRWLWKLPSLHFELFWPRTKLSFIEGNLTILVY